MSTNELLWELFSVIVATATVALITLYYQKKAR